MTREERLVELCRELIRRPSLSGKERAAAEFMVESMKALGYDAVSIDRYGSVLGCVRGKRPGKTVLLDGHMDTVPVAERARWTHDPFGGKIEDGRIYGRGASDMKGGVAAMTEAAARFAEDSGRDFAGTIYVSCSVQEELFEGVSCREIIKNAKPDYVIIGESTAGALQIGQRGRAEVVVETEGVSCHSSNPKLGVNAVYHMMELVGELQTLVPGTHPLLGEGISELTDIRSDPYPGASVVPGRCRATYDRRLLVGETAESVLNEFRAAIERTRVRVPELKARAYLAEGENLCWTGENIRATRFFPAWALDESDTLVQ
ncbi:MAG: YgeY family selenium metabolism-linked hydrolase, partial [Oscillibacter sp.]